jgi:hypothetical protein
MEINSKWTEDLCIEPEPINLLKVGKVHGMGLSNNLWMCSRAENKDCVLTRHGRDDTAQRENN